MFFGYLFELVCNCRKVDDVNKERQIAVLKGSENFGTGFWGERLVAFDANVNITIGAVGMSGSGSKNKGVIVIKVEVFGEEKFGLGKVVWCHNPMIT